MISSTDALTEDGPLPDHMSYQGQLLIAMPVLNDQPFNHSVIYVCQHDEDHAMGLILNQPITGLNFSKMMKELGIESDNPRFAQRLAMQKIYRGGPVQNDRGFVLHSLDYQIDDITLDLGGPFISRPDGEEQGVGLTASRDILVDLSAGSGPARSLIALGYAGWGPGQLDNEMRHHGWYAADAHDEVLFGTRWADRWTATWKAEGIDPALLANVTGRA